MLLYFCHFFAKGDENYHDKNNNNNTNNNEDPCMYGCLSNNFKLYTSASYCHFGKESNRRSALPDGC